MQIFGTHDDAARAQLAKVAERARKVALMADGHVGYVMPIGGVAAYENAVSVVGVGFDIACGNAAIRTSQVGRAGAGDRGTAPARAAGGTRLLAPDAAGGPLRLRRPGVGGPEGGGDPRRRGAGAGAQPSQLRLEGAARGRGAGGGPEGATPAFPGQFGFIGGSMGDDAVIVRGAVSEEPAVTEVQRQALYSTVHGAGRVMSRTAAAGKRHRKTGRVLSKGRITPEMMQGWIAEKGVVLRGGGLDESPQVYRRLPEVLAAQGPTIEVLHTLRPLIVVMAGADEFDPYKD